MKTAFSIFFFFIGHLAFWCFYFFVIFGVVLDFDFNPVHWKTIHQELYLILSFFGIVVCSYLTRIKYF